MPTPNSTEQSFDVHTDPSVTESFGTNVGETIQQQVEFDAPATSEGRVCNVGRTERRIRLGTGTALLAAAAFAPVSRGWRIGFAVFGVAEIVTGAMAYCPLWQALDINTREREEPAQG